MKGVDGGVEKEERGGPGRNLPQKLEINSEKPLACLNASRHLNNERTVRSRTPTLARSAFKTRGCSLKPTGSVCRRRGSRSSTLFPSQLLIIQSRAEKNASSNNSTCHSGVGQLADANPLSLSLSLSDRSPFIQRLRDIIGTLPISKVV